MRRLLIAICSLLITLNLQASSIELTPKKRLERKVKIVLLGDSNVGKTNISQVYVYNSFLYNSIVTMGINIGLKRNTFEDLDVLSLIYDTCGLTRLHKISRLITAGADAIMLVYSVDDKYSLINIKKVWFEIAKKHAKKSTVIILVGAKADMQNRVVSLEDGRKMGEELNIPFFEVSAKTNSNIDMVFNYILNLVVMKKS